MDLLFVMLVLCVLRRYLSFDGLIFPFQHWVLGWGEESERRAATATEGDGHMFDGWQPRRLDGKEELESFTSNVLGPLQVGQHIIKLRGKRNNIPTKTPNNQRVHCRCLRSSALLPAAWPSWVNWPPAVRQRLLAARKQERSGASGATQRHCSGSSTLSR